MQAGLQLHLPTYSRYPLPKLLEVSARAAEAGVRQIWVTDNLRNRNLFVVLSALACRLNVRLGTAIMVQYFHNPIAAASAFAAITELMAGDELAIGIGHGNSLTPNQVRCPRPITMLRELALALRRLLDGEKVDLARYPLLCSYFNLVPGEGFRIESAPARRVTLWCGGNGEKSLAVGGQHMDGVLFGGSLLPALASGRLSELFAKADAAATSSGRQPLPKVAEIKLSVATDRDAAIQFARRQMSHWVLQLHPRGYTDEQIAEIGIDVGDLGELEAAAARGCSRDELVRYVTDGMVHAVFVAGDARECRMRVAQISRQLRDLGVDQMMFSELGPDLDGSMRLFADEVLETVA